MAHPITREALGAVNGVNAVFETAVEYRPGTMQVLRNGHWLQPSQWSEVSAKKVRLVNPPEAGDFVELNYLPI